MTIEKNPLVVVKNASLVIGNQQILKNLSFIIGNKEIVAIVGESGSGKSMTALCLMGLQTKKAIVKASQISFDSQDLMNFNSQDWQKYRGNTIGIIFQDFKLIPYLNVMENIRCSALPLGQISINDKLEKLLSILKLDHRRLHVPSQLSAGEKQRTAIARAMITSPRFILADEPTGNLDEENTEIVLKALRDYSNNNGSVLMVSHDPNIECFTDRHLKMSAGGFEEK